MAALLLPVWFLSDSATVSAGVYGKKQVSVERAATIFRKACLQTATSFAGFEKALRAYDFFDDGKGLFVDGVHDMALQIWRGEGRVFCTIFYTRPLFLATPNQSLMNVARQFTEIGVPLGPFRSSRYDAATRRYLSPIAKDLTYEHRVMDDVASGHLMRAVLVTPAK